MDRKVLLAAALLASAPPAHSEDVVMMSADWAAAACEAWNADEVLTRELVASDWIRNDKDRGFKVMQLYRSDCGDAPTAELRVALVEGEARCVYGGAVETHELDKGTDYVMHATSERWLEMGADEYGPMKAMMLRRLRFSGPYGEAMGNMGPFKNFLLLVGKVPGSVSSCP
jgi:putative sterol carrier protein